MKSTKIRLDQALVSRTLVASREKATRLIMAGQVRVNGQVAHKASVEVSDADKIELEAGDRFVSRGGHKMQAALDHFKINVTGKTCLDIGASTGGFTDCLLQAGAQKIHAIDVGDAQLDWKLRQDSRVACTEGLNARYLKAEDIGEPIDMVVIDVSFISVEKILPAAIEASKASEFVILIKPQFEAGREQIRRGGVVRDESVRQEVIERIRAFVEKKTKLQWIGVVESPLKGPAGNVEYLAYLRTL